MVEATSAMRRANKLSKLGLGITAPNPIVGALVLNPNGEVVGEGFHHRENGGKHAEVVALEMAGRQAEGGTLVLTLEPCNHHGNTPPCSEAIVKAGIRKVIFSVADPNPKAAGGAAHLIGAGIVVESGLLADEIEFTNRAWLKKINSGRPYITLKIATTLDGKVAASDGSSKWITNEMARAQVHELRSECDAIVTGTGTVIADDPAMTVREVKRVNFKFNPARVVMGKRGIPAGSKILDESSPTIHLESHNLSQLLELADERGWNRILVEAGPKLTSAFLKSGLFDEIYLYQAPTLLGGNFDFVGDFEGRNLNERMDLEIISTDVIGESNKNVVIHLKAVAK
ncbi:MAG: bifunctional diaminohydroxyphosphoribosylaminopyrimidine deaminase/5-amino-6-(5-phosphoribosylamino)uracil reductase RibD [Candidatus Nanopelagicaceae bacterium]